MHLLVGALLLLLATLAFSISGYQRWLQQDWLTLGSVLAAWLLVIWLIRAFTLENDNQIVILAGLGSMTRPEGAWLAGRAAARSSRAASRKR